MGYLYSIDRTELQKVIIGFPAYNVLSNHCIIYKYMIYYAYTMNIGDTPYEKDSIIFNCFFDFFLFFYSSKRRKIDG